MTVLLFGVAAVDAWWLPAVCFYNDDGSRRDFTNTVYPCCPPYLNSLCGSAQGRGICAPMNASTRGVTPDDRDPAFLFNYKCKCNGNFWGHNCGDCAPGWTGPNCNVQNIIIIRNILTLSASELQAFHAMMHYCNTLIDDTYGILEIGNRFNRATIKFIRVSYYAICIAHHYHVTKPYVSNNREIYSPNWAHGYAGFLPYHRFWMMMCNKQLQRCMQNPYVHLPYYKWEDDPGCAPCNNNYMGAHGIDGRLSVFSIYSYWGVCTSRKGVL